MNTKNPEGTMTQSTNYPILLVDDDEQMLQTEHTILSLNGLSNVALCTDSRNVLSQLEKTRMGLVILDITMPHIDGIELLKKITQHYPETTVIMITGSNDTETAVSCIQIGAYDYMVKPIDAIRFVTSVKKAIDHRMLAEESERLRDVFFSQSLKTPHAFKHIIGNSSKIISIFRYVEALAPTKLPLLITGETGAGKELFAKAVHLASGMPGEFVSVNTAGIDDALLSDTLFGHTKGAFTGALKDREGLIHKAAHGTLFLDEIGDLKPESQVKLLRLIQEDTYYKVGTDYHEKSYARIVAATNVDLFHAQQNNRFRKDLYYRLKSHRIDIPPLREHREDIQPLVDHFIEQAAGEMQKKKPTVPQELYILLNTYFFPGNIRELRGLVYDAISRHSGGILSCQSFKKEIFSKPLKNSYEHTTPITPVSLFFPDPLPTAKQVEEALVQEALTRAKGNKTLAAQMMGITRKTLRNKIS